MTKFIYLMSLLLALSGCAEVVIQNALNAPETSLAETRTVHSYLWGFYTPALARNRADLCPKTRSERLEFYAEPGDVLLSVVTLGIYIPREVKISCAVHGQASN